MDVARTSPANIPSVDRLLNSKPFAMLLATFGRTQVTAALREHLDSLRRAALAGTLDPAGLTDAVIGSQLRSRLQAAAMPGLRAVFNLTGTVLHTNLGR